MTRGEFMQQYWRYYIALENKFIYTTNYVEVCTDNFKTYSVEYAYLLQSIGGELDNFFKEYCSRSSKKCKNIIDYGEFILGDELGNNGCFTDITSKEIQVSGNNIKICPYKNWIPRKTKETLNWWTAYNSVKHNRISSMNKASLENVINILAALFLLEMKYILEITNNQNQPDSPVENPSQLFTIMDWSLNWIPMLGSCAHVIGSR